MAAKSVSAEAAVQVLLDSQIVADSTGALTQPRETGEPSKEECTRIFQANGRLAARCVKSTAKPSGRNVSPRTCDASARATG